MTLLRHPYSGLYCDNEYIRRYAACDGVLTTEEAFTELVKDGFQLVRIEDIDPDPTLLLSALIEGIVRIADNTGRMASGLEAFAKQAPLLTPPIGVERVAELAQVTVKTVYRWKAEGQLKPLAENKPLLFDQAEVHDFIRRRRRRGEDGKGKG